MLSVLAAAIFLAMRQLRSVVEILNHTFAQKMLLSQMHN